jgi:thiamine pyrophosphokinase
MKAIVAADGQAPSRERLDRAWPGWADGVELVVAADGGAIAAVELGLAIDVLVGDMDSLDAEQVDGFRRSGVVVEAAPVAKDESDTELALLAAVARGADRVVVVGAFGGPRLDHALANIGLLALPALDDCVVELIDERTRVRALRAPGSHGEAVTRQLPGPVGGLVSLLVLGGGAEGIATRGLRYPLRDEPLVAGPARGLSNVRVSEDAAVTLRRGLLLVVESAATLDG